MMPSLQSAFFQTLFFSRLLLIGKFIKQPANFVCLSVDRQPDQCRTRSSVKHSECAAGGIFITDCRGSVAVEFAIVAMPFLGLVGAILQVAFQIWAAQNFERALQNTVRTIFTGQFQLANASQTDAATLLSLLKTTMCGPTTATTPVVFNCRNVKFDVSTVNSFAGATPPKPINTSSGTWTSSFGTNYACAKPGTIVMVTAAVPFPTFFNLLGLDTRQFTSGAENGFSLLTSTAVFRTEPYQMTGAAAC
ncbi:MULTISPECIES: TadE/TadG family type IV pilus assembly protein [Methylobacterium]|jgi:Flp pilus assembly protein TadG|uniref:TadE/TadG family type IV pilus assembly protein n=1 Tax=Methylobacterium TaxID=407 RepID=UPI000B25B061|nr:MULTISPECIES: TadE/TadG family type IV pilus assembly protein [Methylobacterium]UHC20257.1 pilus assembly protein [Methylobacterium currus]